MMVSAGDASLTVWTQSQLVTKSFLCMCARDLSNEDTVTDDPKEGEGGIITQGTVLWMERYY